MKTNLSNNNSGVLVMALVAFIFAACASNAADKTPKEPTGTTSAKLQFESLDNSTFGATAKLEAYVNAGDSGGCDESDITGTPVASETVMYTEVMEVELFGLESDVEYCFFMNFGVDGGGGGLYIDTDDDGDPDTLAEGATLETNPVGPVMLDAGGPNDPVTFTVLYPTPVVDEEFGVTEVGFTVDTDCPEDCDADEICGRLNSDLVEAVACYELCTNNPSCSAGLCVRGPNINAAIDEEVGITPIDYAGVCAEL